MPIFETPVGLLLLTAIAAYLLGSVPFGIVMARLFGLGDLRQIGSGNIGATNVLRTGNKVAAFLTLLCDSGKGAFAVFVTLRLVGNDAAHVAGLFAFLGHLYPVYLSFKGGKGVATFLGTVLALSFPVGLACCLTWLATAWAFRFSSLAALTASATSAVWVMVLGRSDMLLLVTLLILLIFYSHRENIGRLKSGTESKIGQKG